MKKEKMEVLFTKTVSHELVPNFHHALIGNSSKPLLEVVLILSM